MVENFRPGVMERLGLGFEAARELHPDVIYVSASGYGAEGPYRDLPGQDLLIQALSGVAAITGRAEEPPVPAGAAIIDQHGGALLAMATLAAVLHRERTGEGQRVEIVMMDAALNLYTEPVVYHLNGAPLERPRSRVSDTFHEAPYGIYPTADGSVAISMARIADLRAALGGPEALARFEDPRVAFTLRDEISLVLAGIVAGMSTDDVVSRLRARNLWCAAVNDLEAAFEDPAIRALDPVLDLALPDGGRVRVLKHPARYGAGEPELRHLPPLLGAHTTEVLEELGYSAADVEALRTAGAV